jgi:outer membrane protein OmpA-like peptidoglycan-associated protein
VQHERPSDSIGSFVESHRKENRRLQINNRNPRPRQDHSAETDRREIHSESHGIDTRGRQNHSAEVHRQVCPASTTQYTIAATGPGGRGTAAATVAVTPPPTPAAAPAPRVVDRLTIQLHFDFDKATIGPAGQAELEKAVAFVKRYPGAKVSVAGHTDSTGTDEYNMGLSQRRATAVKDYLVKQGAADAQRITTVGYGETRPIASNATPEGRTQNRRAEILILSE